MMEKRQASSFYQHFDSQERPVVDYYTGLFNRFIFKGQPILTDFLNPREQFVFKTIVGNEAQILEDGGYSRAEKKRLYLSEWGDSIDLKDFNIMPLSISYNAKWDKINHSQILGVLTHLGVDNSTFGDIITDDNGEWQFFVKKELSEFFIENIERIGHSKVKLQPISRNKIINVSDNGVEDDVISVSLRLDTVVAAITNLSRSQVKRGLLDKMIKLNWHDVTESNIIINVNDVLSVRHFGRIKIIKIGSTKKGKYRLTLKLWQSKKR